MKQKIIGIVVLTIVLVGVSFWLWSQKKAEEPKGAVETAKTVSESIPEIETNIGTKVPEINPLDRANPFKYINPLR